MSVVVYPAVVTTPEAGSLHARFPDFADLTVTAKTPAELIRAAREALARELRRLEADGEAWPDPSAVEALGLGAGGSLILVDVSVDDPPARINISIGERLLKRIDRDAELRSMTRSGYLALGARRLLGETSIPPGGEGDEPGRRLQEEIAALGRRVTETLGPNSPVGRTLADLDAIALDGLRRLGGEMRSAMGRRPRSAGPGEDPETGRASPRDPDPGPDARKD